MYELMHGLTHEHDMLTYVWYFFEKSSYTYIVTCFSHLAIYYEHH